VPTTKAFPLLLPNTQDEGTLEAQERKSIGAIPGNQQSTPKIKQITLLKSLLDPKQLQMSNHVFVKGLLSAEGGFWVPTDDEELNPIRHAIGIGQRPLIEAFMDYGVKYAKTCHPSYLLPVVRCMKELSEKYPDLVESMFKKSSYAPALNHGYINSQMIVAGSQYRMWFKSLLMFYFPGRGLKKSNNLDDYCKPVFSLRSQLPIRAATFISLAQVTVSTEDPTLPGGDFSANIAKRYLPHMRGVFYAAIANGCMLIVYEIVQFSYDKKRYLRSPYNYMDLITYITCVTGCIMFLNERPPVGAVDSGPHQTEALSFAILALYLNLLFELRIFKQLGIVVNMIFNIAQKIIWFLMILGFFMISFTLALQHLLHTRQYRPACIIKDSNTTNTTNTTDMTCDLEDYSGGYPTNVFAALTDTYFFLVGRYEPVGNSLDKGSTSFRIMMLIFFLFTAILLLNILIALMNDAYDHSKSQGEVAWLKQLSMVISEVERFWMIKRDREESDYFPDYIYYYAPEQDAEIYESKEQITDKSNLSPENKFLMDTMTERYDRLSAAHDDMRKEFEENQEARSELLLVGTKSFMDAMAVKYDRLLEAHYPMRKESEKNQKVQSESVLEGTYPAVGVKGGQPSKNTAPAIDPDLDDEIASARKHWIALRTRMKTIHAVKNFKREYTIEYARLDKSDQDTVDGKDTDDSQNNIDKS
ncbi:hypothetical protein BGX27_006013, partial [Mortierella sp. AM989]